MASAHDKDYTYSGERLDQLFDLNFDCSLHTEYRSDNDSLFSFNLVDNEDQVDWDDWDDWDCTTTTTTAHELSDSDSWFIPTIDEASSMPDADNWNSFYEFPLQNAGGTPVASRSPRNADAPWHTARDNYNDDQNQNQNQNHTSMNMNMNTNNNMTGQQPQYSTLPSYGSLAHILDDPPYPAENRREPRRDLAWERDGERELQFQETVRRADAQRLVLERQRQEMLRTSDPFPFASFNYEYTSGGDTVMREAPAAAGGPGPERESVDDSCSDSAASQDEIEDEAAAAAQGCTHTRHNGSYGADAVEDKIGAERERIARAEWVDIHARALAHGHRRPEWCDREDSPASAETADPPRPITPEDIIPDMHYHEYTMGGGVDWMEWIDKDEPEPMYESEHEEESEVEARHRAAQAMIVHPWNWFAEDNEKGKEPEESRETEADELDNSAYRKWETSSRGLPDGDAEYEYPTESPSDSGSETETESQCNGQCERERETRSESESRTAENDENNQTETEVDTPLRESHITNLKTSLLTLYPPSQFIKLPLVKEYIARLTLEEMQSILEKHLLADAHAVLIRRTLATLETRPSGSRRFAWAPAKSALFRELFPPNIEDTTMVEDFSLVDALRKLDRGELREAIPGTLELMTTENIWAVVIAPKVRVVEPVLIELYGAAAAMGLETGVGFGIGCAEWWERQGATLAEGL